MATHLLLMLAIGAVCAWLLAKFVSGLLAGILVIVLVAYVVGLLIDGSRHPS